MISAVSKTLGDMFGPQPSHELQEAYDINAFRTKSHSKANSEFHDILPSNIKPSALPLQAAAFANRSRMGGYQESDFMQFAGTAMRDEHADTFYQQHPRPFTQSKPPAGTSRLLGDIRPHVPNYEDKAQTFKYLAMTHLRHGNVDHERTAIGPRKARKHYTPQTPVRKTYYDTIQANAQNVTSYRGW